MVDKCTECGKSSYKLYRGICIRCIGQRGKEEELEREFETYNVSKGMYGKGFTMEEIVELLKIGNTNVKTTEG